MKQYRLLKDYKDLTKGSLVGYRGDNAKAEVKYQCGTLFNAVMLSQLEVENNPDWFELVEEEVRVTNKDLHNIQSILEENQRLKEENSILTTELVESRLNANSFKGIVAIQNGIINKQWSDADMIEFGFDIAHTRLIVGSMYELNSDVAKRLEQFKQSKQK